MVKSRLLYKPPLNPPLPKGETPISSLRQREVGRDFTNGLRIAKEIQFLKFLFIGLLVFLMVSSCKEKVEKSSLPELGTPAINFNCQDLKGETWNLDRVRGKIVLLRFWADWCPSCRYEMPVIDKFYRRLDKEGFLVLAVNVKQSREVALAFTAQLDITFPVPLDPDGQMAKRYGVYGIPTSFLIDRDGVIREILIGEVFKEERFMRDLLKDYFKM